MEEVIEHVHNLLLDHLPVRSRRSPSGWITMDCPMCNDRRHRGGITRSGGRITYNCFNCGFKTGWSPSPYLGKRYKQLAERLGATTQDIHRAQLEIMKHGDELSDADYTGAVHTLSRYNTVHLPEGATPLNELPEDHELVVYARERGVYGLHPLYSFEDCFTDLKDKMKWKHRLIFPFYYDDDIVAWSGRHINPPNKKTPKYLVEHCPNNFVFNVDSYLDHPREIVVVVEGIMDAIAVDGVAVLSNKMSAEQANTIQKLGNRVIVCPDQDKAGRDLIKQAMALGWEVSFPPWEGCKDAAKAALKYGRLATLASIIKHATNNEIKIKVKMKIMENE